MVTKDEAMEAFIRLIDDDSIDGYDTLAYYAEQVDDPACRQCIHSYLQTDDDDSMTWLQDYFGLDKG